MKKATVFILILSFIFVLVSCKTNVNEEITSSEANVSPVFPDAVTDEAASQNGVNEETSVFYEQTSSEAASDITENEAGEESTRETEMTENAVEEQTSIKEEPVTITDGKIIAPDYSLDIPKNFEVKSEGNNPLLENKKGTIQFNITDKTKVVKDFDAYVSDTYKAAELSGIAESGIEEIVLKDVPMKRFSMTVTNDEGEALDSYIYFLKLNNKVLMITLTSKDGGLKDSADADKFVESIDFQNHS